MERVDTPTEMDVDVVVGEAEMEVPAEEEVVAADGAADDPFEFDIHIKIEYPNVPTTLRVNEETTVGAVMKTLVKRGNIPPDTHVMIFRARVITDESKTMSIIGLQPDANATVAPRALFSSQWALQPTPATTPSADAAPADAPPLAGLDYVRPPPRSIGTVTRAVTDVDLIKRLGGEEMARRIMEAVGNYGPSIIPTADGTVATAEVASAFSRLLQEVRASFNGEYDYEDTTSVRLVPFVATTGPSDMVEACTRLDRIFGRLDLIRKRAAEKATTVEAAGKATAVEAKNAPPAVESESSSPSASPPSPSSATHPIPAESTNKLAFSPPTKDDALTQPVPSAATVNPAAAPAATANPAAAPAATANPTAAPAVVGFESQWAAMDDSFVAQSPFAGLTPGYTPGGLTAGFTGQGPFVDSSAPPGTPGQPGTPGGPGTPGTPGSSQWTPMGDSYAEPGTPAAGESERLPDGILVQLSRLGADWHGKKGKTVEWKDGTYGVQLMDTPTTVLVLQHEMELVRRPRPPARFPPGLASASIPPQP